MLTVDIDKHVSPLFSLEAHLTAPAGVTILFGASGSGKTMLLRCLAGLTRPDAGRIRVNDRMLFDSIAGIDIPVQHRHIGYVFQQLALFPHLSIEDNIGYGLTHLPSHERRARIAAIADAFHISVILPRKPAHTSGGERQRAALARALVTTPSLLLLDEPLSALDHAIQSRIMDDLRQWNETHRIPIVYVTHNHREVFALGDRVIALESGRVVATGSPHEVLDQPGRPALASLAGFENVFDAVITERRETAGTMTCRLQGSETELEVPMHNAVVGETIRVAIRAGDILVANQEPHGVSARNVLNGTLVALRREGATMMASVDAGHRFEVHLTPAGADSLGLRAGARAWLIIKTYSCRLVA
ncbi:MAG TPA: molybdenum ABC transporter ATP-binding protein [Vicinamibacterales bacterium]|nr:molybdenum ABC transporter ATP-binding protein [Vicinamibacterales bacterium]